MNKTPVEIHFYHCDHLGTPIALTDRNGKIVWAARYDPWGNIEEEFNPHNIEQNIRLPGQHHDRETGLYYNRHRYYDPKIGAYINQDPIGLMGGANFYSYAYSSPNMRIDPRGLDVSECSAPIEISWVPDLLAEKVLPEHKWLKTGKYEAGMGANCPSPGEQCSDIPYSDTKTKDHSGQSQNRKNAKCTPLKDIDEECVNEKIKPGQPTGTWHPLNNCHTFVNDVKKMCKTKPPSEAKAN
jgi:RHS repeat-associated protein